MKLTRATSYALRALVLLTQCGEDQKSDLGDLARRLGAPSAFLGKVLQGLAKAGIVQGHRGAHGGYRLAMSPEKIDVRSVVEAMEGSVRLAQCLEPKAKCSREKNCGANRFLQHLQNQINSTLESETVASLAAIGTGE